MNYDAVELMEQDEDAAVAEFLRSVEDLGIPLDRFHAVRYLGTISGTDDDALRYPSASDVDAGDYICPESMQ
ncbi:UNVERIFIED_ORG: hypothetical protein J2Y81_000764 [Paraburkholderia sediminicola]|nr:hypothetical protein [Paraburkholderia sediminicola]